ncbi:MAG: hypothetical protein IID08_07950 [Candidatus Hydrogenedentes bacterium]|nr:hypothetical protein [Candidatus Hydrogenedentota bacterium]
MARSDWLTVPTRPDKELKVRMDAAEAGNPLDENDGRIAALKDRHRGEVGWLIGNGPSVRVADLERLRDAVTFCCNRIYLAYDDMKFRPTYLCSTDRQMIGDFGQEMVDRHPGTVCFVSEEPPPVSGDYVHFRHLSRTPLEFSENVYDFVMPGGGTLISAAQIGYHMGIRKFYLYGVDHNFTFEKNEHATEIWDEAKGDGNHFIQDYRSGKPWAPPVLWQVEGALLSLHVFLQSKGGWIKNGTRGGCLDVLDRVEFDKVVPSATSISRANE